MEKANEQVATKEIVAEYKSLLNNPIDDNNASRINEIEEEYDLSSKFFSVDGKTGIKNCLGEVLVPAEFDSISAYMNFTFSQIPSLVCKDGLWGVVAPDGKGTVIIPLIYTDAHYVIAPFFAMKNSEGKWGLVDTNGNVRIPFAVDCIYEDSNDGYVFFEKGGKIGVYQYYYNPAILTEPIFDDIIEACTGNFLRVEIDGHEGYVTVDGKFISDEEYDAMTDEQQDELEFICAE